MRRKVKVGSAILLLVFLGVGGRMLLSGRESHDMREAREMQKRLFDASGRQSITADQRTEEIAELKTKAKSLSKEDQVRLGKEYYEQAMKEKVEYVDNFFALKTKEERNAFLDKAIDRGQAVAKKKPNMKGTGKDRSAAKQEQAKGRIRTAEDMQNGLRKFLDSAPADQRVRFQAFKEALAARRKERGLQ